MKSRKRSKTGGALSFSVYILLIIVAAVLIRQFVVERVVVVGESMVPTLQNEDNVIIEKISGHTGKINRYDIVVFPRNGVLLIKRVYGKPGENIRIDESGLIYINDEPLDDRYAFELINDTGLAGGEGITLGADEYFVLGDNRNNSVDSRFAEVGNVSARDIRGRVVFRITPLSKIGRID